MSLPESILIGLFVMAVVFSVLGILWAIVRLFSLVINKIESKTSGNNNIN